MSTDQRIQEAMSAGQRNAEVLKLIKNWCAHARIEKFGGVGVVEEMTGLPIGHHFMECDHAPAGGIAAWDLAATAVQFYDDNCATCQMRKPVGLPNVLELVQVRDAEIAAEAAKEAAWSRQLARERTARDRTRANIRAKLQPPATDIIDQIGELDAQPTTNLHNRLIETAKVANNYFTVEVVDYIFRLVRDAPWFAETGLRVLREIGADGRRLCKTATVCLTERVAMRVAAGVVFALADEFDPRLLGSAFPALVDLASPEPLEAFLPGRQRPPVTGPLIRLYERHHESMSKLIEVLLGRDDPKSVGLAARAIVVIARRDHQIPVQFARPLLSRLARSKWMPARDDHGIDRVASHVAMQVKQALELALRQSPAEVDAIAESLLGGTSNAGEARIFSVYQETLHRSRFKEEAPIGEADRVAFRRLLWQAPRTRNEALLRTISHVFSGKPYGLLELIRGQVDALFGAAMLMDDRLNEFEAEADASKSLLATADSVSFLVELEWRARRQSLTQLRSVFARWAAEAAAIDLDGRTAFLKLLDQLPEERERLRSDMIEALPELARDLDGLRAILPPLYSAMVRSSTAVRGAAAKAYGEMRRWQIDGAPELLSEAFVALLTDPYKIVHQRAVDALAKRDLAERFAPEVQRALYFIILAYADDHDEGGRFLAETIFLFASRYTTPSQRTGRLGEYLVRLLSRLPAYEVAQHVRWLCRDLGSTTGFANLLLDTLTDPNCAEGHGEDLLTAVRELPVDMIRRHAPKMAEVARHAPHGGLYWSITFVEALSHAEGWSEAAALAHAVHAGIPDTTRDRIRRLTAEQAVVATGFEAAIAEGCLERAVALAPRWEQLNQELESSRVETP